MNAIVAVDQNWAIGKNNQLLVKIPEDMQFFRKMTLNNIVIMGKNTLESFPGGKPLKNRQNIVVALEADYIVEGARVVHSIEDAVKAADELEEKKVFVVGGASIYAQMLPYCDTVYVTKIEKSFDADAFFTNLDQEGEWEIEEESQEQSHEGLKYRFCKYTRMK